MQTQVVCKHGAVGAWSGLRRFSVMSPGGARPSLLDTWTLGEADSPPGQLDRGNLGRMGLLLSSLQKPLLHGGGRTKFILMLPPVLKSSINTSHSIHDRLSRAKSGEAAKALNFPLHFLHFFRWNPKSIPGQRDTVPPSCCSFSPGPRIEDD